MKISLGQYLNALTVVELYHEQLKEKNKEALKGVNPVFNRALKDCKVLGKLLTTDILELLTKIEQHENND